MTRIPIKSKHPTNHQSSSITYSTRYSESTPTSLTLREHYIPLNSGMPCFLEKAEKLALANPTRNWTSITILPFGATFTLCHESPFSSSLSRGGDIRVVGLPPISVIDMERLPGTASKHILDRPT